MEVSLDYNLMLWMQLRDNPHHTNNHLRQLAVQHHKINTRLLTASDNLLAERIELRKQEIQNVTPIKKIHKAFRASKLKFKALAFEFEEENERRNDLMRDAEEHLALSARDVAITRSRLQFVSSLSNHEGNQGHNEGNLERMVDPITSGHTHLNGLNDRVRALVYGNEHVEDPDSRRARLLGELSPKVRALVELNRQEME